MTYWSPHKEGSHTENRCPSVSFRMPINYTPFTGKRWDKNTICDSEASVVSVKENSDVRAPVDKSVQLNLMPVIEASACWSNRVGDAGEVKMNKTHLVQLNRIRGPPQWGAAADLGECGTTGRQISYARAAGRRKVWHAHVSFGRGPTLYQTLWY